MSTNSMLSVNAKIVRDISRGPLTVEDILAICLCDISKDAVSGSVGLKNSGVALALNDERELEEALGKASAHLGRLKFGVILRHGEIEIVWSRA